MKDLKILHPNHCSTAPETLMRPIWWWKTLEKFKKCCSQIVFPPFPRQDGFLATWDPYKMIDLKILHLNHCSTAPETLMRPCLCQFKVSNFMLFFIFVFDFFPPSAEWWVLVFNNWRSASHYFHLTTSSPPPLFPPSAPRLDSSTVLHFPHLILSPN